MSDIIEQIKLHNLYMLKTLGFEYYDDIVTTVATSRLDLPNDYQTLHNQIKSCTLCNLAKTRENVIVSNNFSGEIDVMFILENPSKQEDENNSILLGKSGQMLSDIITKVLGLELEQVYITNFIKCRMDTTTKLDEHTIISCKEYILKQIEIINPKIIVTLGENSYNYLTDDKSELIKIRGHKQTFLNRTLIPTFHPNFLLRNPSYKKDVMVDMLLVKGEL